MRYLFAGFLTSLLATIDQLFVMQKSAFMASLTTILLIFISTHVVVDITSTTNSKLGIFFYALGGALGTFLAVKFF